MSFVCIVTPVPSLPLPLSRDGGVGEWGGVLHKARIAHDTRRPSNYASFASDFAQITELYVALIPLN